MSIGATQPNQQPLSDLQTLEPFVDQFAQAIATQEGALHTEPSPEVQRALMRVRQTWLERNAAYVALGAGIVGSIVLYKVLR
jgi:hypothetical protein